MSKYKENREFMKSSMTDEDLIAPADIAHGVPQPPFQKTITDSAKVIDLPEINFETV